MQANSTDHISRIKSLSDCVELVVREMSRGRHMFDMAVGSKHSLLIAPGCPDDDPY
jgi:hypothetical protein